MLTLPGDEARTGIVKLVDPNETDLIIKIAGSDKLPQQGDEYLLKVFGRALELQSRIEHHSGGGSRADPRVGRAESIILLYREAYNGLKQICDAAGEFFIHPELVARTFAQDVFKRAKSALSLDLQLAEYSEISRLLFLKGCGAGSNEANGVGFAMGGASVRDKLGAVSGQGHNSCKLGTPAERLEQRRAQAEAKQKRLRQLYPGKDSASTDDAAYPEDDSSQASDPGKDAVVEDLTKRRALRLELIVGPEHAPYTWRKAPYDRDLKALHNDLLKNFQTKAPDIARSLVEWVGKEIAIQSAFKQQVDITRAALTLNESKLRLENLERQIERDPTFSKDVHKKFLAAITALAHELKNRPVFESVPSEVKAVVHRLTKPKIDEYDLA